jgi:2-polyprenyl-3-methyl-5-hydroxy-6-metoxy-1,4-benzoquinol methylase
MSIEPQTTYLDRSTEHDHLVWAGRVGFRSFDQVKALDLGCSNGEFLKALKQRGAKQCVGIDTEARSLEGVEIRLADLNAAESFADLRRSFGSKAFDLVTAFDLIEHLDSPWKFLGELHSLVAPKGSLVITTPNIMSWERILRPGTWSGASDPHHKSLFSFYTLSFMLERQGFRVVGFTAPVRALKVLGKWAPNIGGQLCVRAQPV